MNAAASSARRVMTSEQRFTAIQARYARAVERQHEFEQALLRKHGKASPPSAWLTRAEDQKRERIYAAQSREMDKMFALLDEISPRNWRSGVAAWWVVENLTYADAITDGPLSAVPTPGYGSTRRDIERFAAATKSWTGRSTSWLDPASAIAP